MKYCKLKSCRMFSVHHIQAYMWHEYDRQLYLLMTYGYIWTTGTCIIISVLFALLFHWDMCFRCVNTKSWRPHSMPRLWYWIWRPQGWETVRAVDYVCYLSHMGPSVMWTREWYWGRWRILPLCYLYRLNSHIAANHTFGPKVSFGATWHANWISITFQYYLCSL